MKKVLLTLLSVIVVLGVLAGAGFVGYRIGYKQAARAVASKTNTTAQLPQQNKGFDPQRMPMQNFNRGFEPQNMPMLRDFDNGFEHGFNRGMGPRGFGMMGRGGRGFGFFSPFFLLIRVAVWALIIWVIYMVVKGSGWRLSLTRQPTQSAKAETPVVESKTE